MTAPVENRNESPVLTPEQEAFAERVKSRILALVTKLVAGRSIDDLRAAEMGALGAAIKLISVRAEIRRINTEMAEGHFTG